MQKESISFDVSKEDTCMPNWTFNIITNNGSKIIESVKINQQRRGCQGHPKTISALLKNIPLENINTDLLGETHCVREQSCGMVLGSLIEKIKQK